LAELLLENGEAEHSLSHAQRVLAKKPDELKALDLGARAADRIGQRELAASYRRLHSALAGSSPDDEWNDLIIPDAEGRDPAISDEARTGFGSIPPASRYAEDAVLDSSDE